MPSHFHHLEQLSFSSLLFSTLSTTICEASSFEFSIDYLVYFSSSLLADSEGELLEEEDEETSYLDV
jgi:hypothetical protein